MGFFGSIGQVISNRAQFKEWEKADADKQKQREELAKRGISEAQLKKATAEGKVIMDVVDIMDTHSEEVSENIETAIMPVAQLFPVATTLASLAGLGYTVAWPGIKKFDKSAAEFGTKHNEELKNILNTLLEKAQQNSSDSALGRVKLRTGLDDIISPKDIIFGANLKEISEKVKGNEYFMPESMYNLKQLFGKKNLAALNSSGDEAVKNIAKRLGELGKEYYKMPGTHLLKTFGAIGIASAAIGALSFIFANIMAAKIQVRSSRIARWQSREDLKDPKYFVQYTDEQIQNAKNNIEQRKASEKKKGFFATLPIFKKNGGKGFRSENNGFFKTIGATIKDNKNYNEWKKVYNLEDKKVKRPLSPEELVQAEKEQEVIQRVTKIINNKAEDYSENMETTGGVLIGATPFLGAAIGGLINLVMNKTGLNEKLASRSFEKLLKDVNDTDKADELRHIYNVVKTSKKNGAKASISTKLSTDLPKMGEFFEKAWDALYVKPTGKTGKGEAVFNAIKKMTKLINSSAGARNAIMVIAGTFITGIAGSIIGLKLQKASARAGRYIAKRELEENPENFIGYSKEEFNSVGDVKAEKQSLGSKFVNYITFLPRVIKEYFDYEKYRKTQAKEDKELLNELIKTNVTNEQLAEAKELQRKLFTTFESVDDKSQEYSESIEAVNEMTQSVLPYLTYVMLAAPVVAGGIKVIKSGVPGTVESLTKLLAKFTTTFKSKIVTKYLNGVSQNISATVAKQVDIDPKYASNVILKIIKDLPEGVDVSALSKEFQKTLQSVKGKDNELKALLVELSNNKTFRNISLDDINKTIDTLSTGKTAEVLKALGVQIKPEDAAALKALVEAHAGKADNLADILGNVAKNSDIPNIKVSEFKDMAEVFNIPSVSDAISGLKGDAAANAKKIQEALKSSNASGMASAFVEGQIQSGKWRSYAESLNEVFKDYAPVNKILSSILNSPMTDEQALNIYKNLCTVYKNIPSGDLKKIINTIFTEFYKNPDKFMQAMETVGLKGMFITNGLATSIVIGSGAWTALSFVLTFALESAFASMQKKAGRLGVMKALEELKDPNYYANETPVGNIADTHAVGNSLSSLNSARFAPVFTSFVNKMK